MPGARKTLAGVAIGVALLAGAAPTVSAKTHHRDQIRFYVTGTGYIRVSYGTTKSMNRGPALMGITKAPWHANLPYKGLDFHLVVKLGGGGGNIKCGIVTKANGGMSYSSTAHGAQGVCSVVSS
ncbi:MAG: hypothetical protein WA724_03460 [Candidatus Dormiibacterota bacterium]